MESPRSTLYSSQLNFFCYLLRLRRYKQKSVKVCVFWRGWVIFGEYLTGKEASPTNQCWCWKTRVIAISRCIKISAVHHLVLSQYTHLMDGWTELRQQYCALHYTPHGENWWAEYKMEDRPICQKWVQSVYGERSMAERIYCKQNNVCYLCMVWFLRQSHVLQINSLLKHPFKFGYVKSIFTIKQLLENFDDTLLNKASARNHTKHNLLPTPKSTWSVGLGLSVDFIRSELHKKHSSIAWYLRIVIKLSALLTVSFSSLHCCAFGFSSLLFRCFYCTFIHALVMMYCTHNKRNEMKWKRTDDVTL